MTNSSPQNPQPAESETYTAEDVKRIRRNTRIRVTEEITDEWIAVIVAFGAIGAILFWSLGGSNKNTFANLSQNSFFSSSKQTTEATATTSGDLDSQDVVAQENLESSNVTVIADDNQSEAIATTSRPPTSSVAQDNLRQTSKYFASRVPIASVNKAIVPPSVPKVDMAELESKPEVATPPTSEVDTEVLAFSDVTEEYWAYPFLSKLGEQQLIPNSDSFAPDELITRAGMANLISRAFKDSPTIEAPKEFTDLPANSALVDDINKAVSMGFMNGYSEGDFRPEQNIPRYQVLVSLATGLKLEPSGDANTILQNFSDRAQLPEWSLDKVAAATEAGLAVNRPDLALTSLNPNEPATRAEVAAMIYQTLAKSGMVPSVKSEYIVPIP